MVKRKNMFHQLPDDLKIKIFKLDSTYKNIFNNVMKELLFKFKLKIFFPHVFIIMFR